MFPNFLPVEVEQLTESNSIALAQIIKQTSLKTPLVEQPIITSYVHQGSGGTPMLLLHGFDSSVLEFRRLLPLLAEKNETWAVDLLGFGFTDRFEGIKFSSNNIKTHLYYFWETLINQPIILVGASMGGAAAIDFTLTYPKIVKKLVLLDSAGLTSGSSLAKFMFPPLGYLATQFLSNPKIRQSISQAAYKNKTFASMDARACAALHLKSLNWSRALIAFTKSGGYSSFKNKLHNIKQTTLIIWGDTDKILGTADAVQFKQLIKDSQLYWIKDCGHVPHLEKAQITADYILEFCKEK
ncbi:MAG: alpha/beta hydrolase [Cyanobacteria bacterium P01_A01_bin.84]